LPGVRTALNVEKGMSMLQAGAEAQENVNGRGER
jgi:hypothetical protein